MMRCLAALLGAAAGAVAVVSLVSAGPGESPGRAALQAPQPAQERHAPPASEGKDERLAALEDVDQDQDAAQAAEPVVAAAPASGKPEAPRVRRQTLPVSKGDTLMKVLLRAGSERREAHEAITALADVYDLRRLMPGQTVTVAFRDDRKTAARLTDVTIRVSPERDAVARLDDQGSFHGHKIERTLERRAHRAAATIEDSLYLAAQRAEVPPTVIIELIRLYSFDVDFQRDIQPNDSFEVLYESHYVEGGALARHGDVLYAQMTVSGQTLPLYRYQTTDGLVDYFNDKGHSVRKALMKTPIDGARLSSRFGKRRHPILGYTRMHRGVDFAAPSGTPIMAAGRGTVELAGWNGGYGRYIRIRHNGRYKTAYAHLSKFARGVRAGARVRQGQIIGYVGSSGRSTGPHLHYEVHADGRQMNPLGLKLPSGRKLKGEELARFQDERTRLDREFAELASARTLAAKE